MSNSKSQLSNLNQLAWRNLRQHPTRTSLSILAIALGVATIIASSMTSQAIINAIGTSGMLASMQGIIDQLGDTMQMAGVGIGLVAGFMVMSAFLMSITQRRQQIGALRSLGMTRDQVMRLVLAEALVTALIGTMAGVMAGPLMGYGVIALARAALGGVFAFEASNPTLASFVIAIAAGIGITLLAVAIPARQAARTSPLAALRSEQVRASRGSRGLWPAFWLGVLMLVGLGVFIVISLPGEWAEPPQDMLLVGVCLLVLAAGLALALPALIDATGRAARGLLVRLWGASGRLAADNLSRERGRALRTISALAVSLTMIVGLTGFISFAAYELLLPSIERVASTGAWMVMPFDLTEGMSAYSGMKDIRIPLGAIDEIRQVVGERGTVMDTRFVIVPELAFFGDTYFTFLIDPRELEQSGQAMFSFTEGDWDTAVPIMQAGCGALVTPAVANRNGAELGDTITVTGTGGPVQCTIAGIGSPMVNASIIGIAAGDAFGMPDPIAMSIWPGATVDRQALRADVEAVLARYPPLQMNEVKGLYDLQYEMFDSIPLLFNALLLLAVVAAALGVVNTTMMSISERRRELGLLRAVGATRRQVVQVVMGEAALMGLVGGAVGLAAGLGIILVIVLVYGGNAWGAPNLDLWGAAWRSARPALVTGLMGLVAAPIISAAAATFPARSIVRGSAIDTLDEQRTPQTGGGRRPQHGGIMSRLDFLAWRNVRDQWVRTWLTVLAVALGVMMIPAADVIGSAVRNAGQTLEQTGRAGAFVGDYLGNGLQTVGLMILAAAAFLVFNAFAMSITQRQRQIGALRALGATRDQVMRLVLGEAFLIGLGGTVLGLLLGPLVGRGVITLLGKIAGVAHGESTLTAQSILLAASLGIGVTLVSVLVPAWRAAHISPLLALREFPAAGGAKPRRALILPIVGLVILIGLAAYLVAAPPGDWALPPANTLFTGGAGGLLLVAVGLLLPTVIALVSRGARGLMMRLWGASGRLASDNIRRDRGRVLLTIATFAVGVAMIVAITGSLTFMMKGLQSSVIGSEFGFNTGRLLGIFPLPGGLDGETVLDMKTASEWDMATSGLTQQFVSDLNMVSTGKAEIVPLAGVIVPELSIIPGFPSYFVDPEQARQSNLFHFTEGDWEHALPIMRQGCGVLVAPHLASLNNIWLYNTFTASGPQGPVECTVAGIGAGVSLDVTFIGSDAAGAFGVDPALPWAALISVHPETNVTQYRADLRNLLGRYPAYSFYDLSNWLDDMTAIFDTVSMLSNGLLLLAILAASLGAVNTTMMSVEQRRHELGLLRAVGATRRQVMAVVTGEAVLMGIMGGLVGLIVGAGLTVIYVLCMGAAEWGLRDVALWPLAWRSVQPALLNGLVGLVMVPPISALAAWLPTRPILRGTAIETLDAQRTPQTGGSRPMSDIKSQMSNLNQLALRNLQQHPTRTILSILAVALGVAMTLAASMIGQSILGAISGAEGLAYLRGLMEQLGIWFEMAGEAIGLVAGFMVFNAFLMSITQRRQQIGALRSLGMTRGQVMRLVLVEALVVAVIGTLAGMITGPILGAGAAAFARMVLSGMFALKTSSPTLTSVVMAVGIGLGITLLAVLIPARQAARISPLVALRGEVVAGTRSKISSRLAFWVGVLMLVGLAVLVIGAPPGKWAQPAQAILLVWLCLALLALGLALVLPSLVGGVGSLARGILRRVMGTSGRLAADNLGRERGRVVRTLAALAASLALIAALGGILHFMAYEIMLTTLDKAAQSGAWIILPFDLSEGLVTASTMERVEVPDEAADDLRQVIGERGTVLDIHFVVVPELSFIGDTFFSIMADPHALEQSGSSVFAFTEGGWDTAMPIMEQGCGILASPAVAARNGVKPGDRLTVTGKNGPIECILAGTGSSFANATIISLSAGEQFGADNPFGMMAWAQGVWAQGKDRQAVQADMEAALARYPSLHMTEFQTLYEFDVTATEALPPLFNVLLVAATLAAALGVVNTTLMSVTERRRELGLLRAVGATRRQVVQVVVGEAVLIGLVGGVVGLAAGVGITAIVVLVYGGSAWGAPDLDLWGAAWRSMQPALVTGLIGLAAAPLISAGAAYFPAHSILRGSAIETLEPERQETVSVRRAAGRLWRWGSIQTRFALGSALLMLLVLGGLTMVVTGHARGRIEETMQSALRQMVTFNAGMLELMLPQDADNLSLDTLTSGQTFDFNSDTMLEMQALVDDMSKNGLVDFSIADRDNVILMGLDKRDMGMLAPALDAPNEVTATSEREDGRWLMKASAPVRNPSGTVVGSVRMTVDAGRAQDFLDTLRGRLWLIGGLLALIGTGIAWGIGAALARAAQRLAEHAREIGQGAYTPFSQPGGRGLGGWLSVRTRLTLALAGILAITVAALEVAALPIERQHLEATVKDGLVAGAEWIGRTASKGFESGELELPEDQSATLEDMIGQNQTLDMGRLQALGEEAALGKQARTEDLAYLALVDQEGEIVISDQLALVGERAPVTTDTQVEDATWRGKAVWVASTPLRRGEDGEQIGTLRMAMRRERVESFLDEARWLFLLAGLIAVLAGILLAQAIGGAAAAPVAQLAAGARRIGAGDLSVRFRVEGRDELATLANAYNQMVAGLEEREWLRDMFGRFVSQEVAEAIRTGQVKLEGENRVVSVLFCDIRDFTGLSEKYPPQEIVALLNQYLPVVVSAAAAHQGTVNKFGGDSTLVIYGAPRPLAESAYQAVLTALDMQRGLAALNDELAARGYDPIRIGVGINTGEVLAGAVGPHERQEYTVIGDTVNLASRIEGLNKQFPEHSILVSQMTVDALGRHRDEFRLVDLGEVAIRGKKGKVGVWAVEGR